MLISSIVIGTRFALAPQYWERPVFLISSYGHTIGPMRFSSFGTARSLFGPDGAVNYKYKYMYMYDCIVTNSINSLLIVSRRIPNGTHTNHY